MHTSATTHDTPTQPDELKLNLAKLKLALSPSPSFSTKRSKRTTAPKGQKELEISLGRGPRAQGARSASVAG